MSYKIVKDASGSVVAFGPDDEGYQPTVPTGGSIETSEQMPPIQPIPLQERIDAFVRQASSGRVQNELQLEGLTAGLLGVHLASGGTEPQLEVSNSAYRQAKQLRAAVAAMRAQG